MQDELRNCGCNDNCGCGCNNNGSFLGNFFKGSGCGNDSEILFFIIIFLLLFTNFGCGSGRSC